MDNTFAPRGCIRGPILPRFVLTMDMSPGAKTIYAILCDIAADKDHCWPSHARLAELLHCSVSSVKNWLRELVTHKLIAIRRNAARTSTYYMLKPSMLQASGAAFIGKAQEANFTSCQTKFAYRKNFKKDSILPHSPHAGGWFLLLGSNLSTSTPLPGRWGGFFSCRFFIRAVLSALSTQRSQGTCACRLASSLAAWLIARP